MKRLEKTVALTACSNLFNPGGKGAIGLLKETLKEMGLSVLESPYLYEIPEGSETEGERKAQALLDFYRNPEVEAIFDISGGDLANGLLPYLDFEEIKKNPKPFFGYSDLTVLLNAICEKAGQPAVLYQVRNLIREDKERQKKAFQRTFLEGETDLLEFPATFLNGERMEGIVSGGNIRCLLKLAGTPWFPDLQGKILFLESRSGGEFLLSSYFYQLYEMGAFGKISGLLLGTFTELEKEEGDLGIRKVLRRIRLPRELPVAKTWSIGHGADSGALILGEKICLKAW